MKDGIEISKKFDSVALSGLSRLNQDKDLRDN